MGTSSSGGFRSSRNAPGGRVRAFGTCATPGASSIGSSSALRLAGIRGACSSSSALEPLVRCLRDLSSQDGPSFSLPLHEARQVLCHGGLCLSLGLCNRGTSVGGGVHGFDRRGKKDFRLQDRRSRGPLEPKWWPKWILIKSQDKRPPAVNALAQKRPPVKCHVTYPFC